MTTVEGTEEFLPYLCPLDAVISDRTGIGLTRKKTLGEGFDRCEIRFKKGGETHINKPWIKISLKYYLFIKSGNSGDAIITFAAYLCGFIIIVHIIILRL